MKNQMVHDIPSTEALENELKRVNHKRHYQSALKSTIYTLITVAAIAVLVATLWLPVLKIYGASMTPALQDGDIVVATKSTDMETGDVVAFYCNNKILVKRVIASAGDWVDIDEAGVVSVNGVELEEPYLTERAFGETNIELPYQVPDGKLFVMGDHRTISLDSRNTAVGCVAPEKIVGRVVFCVWPFSHMGGVR